MEEAKVRKMKNAKTRRSKGKVINQNGKRFTSRRRWNPKKQMSGDNKQETKHPIEAKTKSESRKVGMKRRVWVPIINNKDGNEFSKSRRELRKLANVVDPEAQIQSSKKLSYAMRKYKVTWKDLKPLAHTNKSKDKVKQVYQPDPLKQCAENDGSDLSDDKVLEAVKALLSMLQEDKTNLFSDEGKDIFLQVTSFKVPKTSPRDIRVVLPHSLLPETPDVCLLTSDLQKGRKIDHEPTVEHFKEYLSKEGVTRISEIITVRQLKTEYDRYELKRALCNRFDLFLSDAKVSGHISHLLGKIFYDRKKIPVPIKLYGGNLKERIETALHKTSYRVHEKGTLFVLKVAHTLLTPEQICENIMTAAVSLTETFPGGWNNVLQLMIKGAKTIPVPFYMSTMGDRAVRRPMTRPKRSKDYGVKYGELVGVGKVKVTPEGDVVVVRNEKMDKLEREIITNERQLIWERTMRKRERMNARAGKKKDEDEDDIFNVDDLGENDSAVDEEEDEEEEDSVTQAKRRRLEEADNESDEAEIGPDVTSEYKRNSDDDNNAREDGINALEEAYLKNWELSQSVKDSKKKKSRKHRSASKTV